MLEGYRELARYNTWMNERLYALCGTLADEERKRDLGAFFRSIHGTLNHILLADAVWLMRCTGDVSGHALRDAGGQPIPIQALDQILYEDFEQLRAQRRRTDTAIAGWVDGLSDDALRGEVTYRSGDGKAHSHPLWWAITHLFNHQTHHRGQLTTLLTQLGHDLGVTDFVVLLRGGVR